MSSDLWDYSVYTTNVTASYRAVRLDAVKCAWARIWPTDEHLGPVLSIPCIRPSWRLAQGTSSTLSWLGVSAVKRCNPGYGGRVAVKMCGITSSVWCCWCHQSNPSWLHPTSSTGMPGSFVVLMAVPATSGTEASKLLPTQDTIQKYFFCGEKEILKGYVLPS